MKKKLELSATAQQKIQLGSSCSRKGRKRKRGVVSKGKAKRKKEKIGSLARS